MKNLSHIPYKLGTFFLALAILSGSIDMTPITVTPYRNTYPSRNGYIMPTQGDYLVATWVNPCTNFMIVTGTGEVYNNTINVLFYRNGEYLGRKVITFQPWSELFVSTEYVYDTAVIINWDGPQDGVIQPWCWWHY